VARIFLVTDYGLDDEFAGVLHAVIARLAPDASVIDLSHGVAPFDVAGAAALLARAAPHLGPGVVCAVVDPGVGGGRRAVAIEVDGDGPRHLVGPDNGVLTEAARAFGIRRAVELRRASDLASTFEGRDLFAPVAARLATGARLSDLGEPLDVDSLVEPPRALVATRATPDGHVALLATVRWIDRFGNVQLNVPGRAIAESSTLGVVVKGEDALVRVVSTFADLDPGTAGLLRDANDAVALVVAQGSAAERFDVAVGDHVELVGSFGPLS
jgi:hypothetical protein